MKKSILLALLASVAVSVPARAAFDPAALNEHFQSLKGRWEGRGTRREAGFRFAPSTFDIELRFDRSGGKWEMRQTRRENLVAGIQVPTGAPFAAEANAGQTSYRDTTFEIGDRGLVWSEAGPSDPVSLIEASATALSWGFRRSDVATGKVFEFTYRQEVFPGEGRLTLSRTVTANGALESVEELEARKKTF